LELNDKWRIFDDKWRKMKQPRKPVKKNIVAKPEAHARVNEPMATYYPAKSFPQVKDFTYHEFKKMADKAPFSQAEWASFLHISERTLQRYAKTNGHFASINAERALQIEKVLKEGKTAFGSYENFYNWLKRNPTMLEGTLSLQSLTTLSGIESILTQLSRIQYGLFA
jgi:putative toxin-antitoxin system antitoxin component (TIGR02293 family)